MAVQGETRERTRTKIKEPGHYRVIMHNDDFTPMDFVVELLRTVFHKEEPEAVHLMLIVHESGRASVGEYPYDIAATKVRTATARANQYSHLPGQECAIRICDTGAGIVCSLPESGVCPGL